MRRQANSSVVEEAGEGSPARQHVADRLGDFALGRQSPRLLAHVGLERDDQGLRAFLTNRAPLVGRLAVDGALDGEQFVDAPHNLGGDWRLAEPCKAEEVPPAMRPTRRLDDRRGYAILGVESIVA